MICKTKPLLKVYQKGAVFCCFFLCVPVCRNKRIFTLAGREKGVLLFVAFYMLCSIDEKIQHSKKQVFTRPVAPTLLQNTPLLLLQTAF